MIQFTGGPETPPFSYDFEVDGCPRSRFRQYRFNTASCGCMDPDFVAAQWKTAALNGNNLASRLTDGDWCLFESPEDPHHDLWLGRAVLTDKLQGQSHLHHRPHTLRLTFTLTLVLNCPHQGDCKQRMESRIHIGDDRYDKGDYRICIRWYELVESDGESHHCYTLPSATELSLMNASRLRLTFGNGPGQIELRSGPTIHHNTRPRRFRPPRRRNGMTITEHREVVQIARETHIRTENERELTRELQRVWQVDRRMIVLTKSACNPSV